jgi:hypothetical protein
MTLKHWMEEHSGKTVRPPSERGKLTMRRKNEQGYCKRPNRPESSSKSMRILPLVRIHIVGMFFSDGATKAAQMGADIVVRDT